MKTIRMTIRDRIRTVRVFRRSITFTMLRYFPQSSQLVVLVLLVSVAGQEETSAKVSNCLDVNGFNVCHYNGVLVKVTQQGVGHQLKINRLGLREIQENAFENVMATDLYLGWDNQISMLKRESFRGLPSLELLNLDHNMVPLSGYLFAELGHLHSLSLAKNNIRSIPADSFAGLSNLTYLYLSHNNIAAIHVGSFSWLGPKLLYLMVDSNKISRVAPGAFAGLTGLRNLRLDSNQLKSLSSGTFRGLNNLQYLFLGNNRIKSIHRTLFRDVINLKRLHLQENKISTLEPGTFQGLSQLYELNLMNNKLSHIVVDAFAGLSELRILALGYNNIYTVDSGSFKNLLKLEILETDGNNITENYFPSAAERH